MVNDNGIFRKVSLDRLSSPEKLDQLLPVTDRKGWLALLAFLAVICTAVAWSLMGSIPKTIGGTGILVTAKGVSEIIPAASGALTEVLVGVGDSVKRGQLVARLAQPELKTRLEQAANSLELLNDQLAETKTHAEEDTALQKAQLAQQRLAIEEAMASARSLRRAMQQKIQSQTRLVEAGLLLNEVLLESRQRRDAAIQRVKDGRSQLAELAVREAGLGNRRIEVESALERKIDETRRMVEDLEAELDAKTRVIANHSGRVVEVLAEPGAVIAAGEPILMLGDRDGGATELEAVVFVPSVFGKQIRVGMQVLVAPSTVKQEEFGMMLAQVTAVSDFPTTVKGMRRILKNDKLVASLSGQDTPYEIRVRLVPDPSTASSYRWSSSKGPPRSIESGTIASANIAVEHRRPIELVIPLIREYTGI